MYSLDLSQLLEAERRKDEMAAVEKQRLIRSLPRQENPGNLRLRHIMVELGRQLVSLGNFLQRRYTDLPVTYPAANLIKRQTGEC